MALSGNEQRQGGLGRRELHAPEHAGRQPAVGVLELGAARGWCRRAVDRIIDEVDLAFVRELVFVDQLEPDRQRHAAIGLACTLLARRIEVAEIGLFIHGELEADRIDEATVASSVVVPAVPPATRFPIETRRSPMRPETGDLSSVNCRVELSLPHGRFLSRDRCLGDTLRLNALIERLLA